MLVKLVLQRALKTGLLGGKRFTISAKVEGHSDIMSFFKGLPDEILVSYRSIFSHKPVTVSRGALLKGVTLSAGSLNEMVEIEDRLKGGAELLKRMIDILEDEKAEIILADGA